MVENWLFPPFPNLHKNVSSSLLAFSSLNILSIVFSQSNSDNSNIWSPVFVCVCILFMLLLAYMFFILHKWLSVVVSEYFL